MLDVSVHLAGENISRAALLKEVQTRATLGMVLWPSVTETIVNLRKIGRWLSDLEIRRAIDSGRITDKHRIRRPTNCWVITIIGLDSEGERLGVILHLPVCRTAILAVTEAFYFPSDFEPEGQVQWE
jgi:hypothetical protein